MWRDSGDSTVGNIFSALFGAVFVIGAIADKSVPGIVIGALFTVRALYGLAADYIANSRARKWDSAMMDERSHTPPLDARENPAQSVEAGRMCPYCGSFVREDFFFCPFCGRKLRRK